MRRLIIISFLVFIGFIVNSCREQCYKYFSEQELQFVAYDENQSLSFLDTSNVVHPLRQTKYRRELFEGCGSVGCSGEHREVYEIEYRSTVDLDWGFNLALYVLSCHGELESYFSVVSDNLKSYHKDRWIFSTKPESEKIKYDSIVINGSTYNSVYEFSGYYHNDKITMLFNHQFGVIRISFPDNQEIALVP